MRLYKIQVIKRPEAAWLDFTGEDYLFPVSSDNRNLPHEWQDHCEHVFGEMRDFHPPFTNRAYLSRSSAKSRLDLFKRWGGEAVLLEAEVSEFIPVEEANLRRRKKRDDERVRKLEEQIHEIKSKYAHAVTLQKLNDMKARMGLDGEAT